MHVSLDVYWENRRHFKLSVSSRERKEKNGKRNLPLLQLPILNYNTQINRETDRQAEGHR